MPDMEKRLEGFCASPTPSSSFPGGVGTAEELLSAGCPSASGWRGTAPADDPCGPSRPTLSGAYRCRSSARHRARRLSIVVGQPGRRRGLGRGGCASRCANLRHHRSDAYLLRLVSDHRHRCLRRPRRHAWSNDFGWSRSVAAVLAAICAAHSSASSRDLAHEEGLHAIGRHGPFDHGDRRHTFPELDGLLRASSHSACALQRAYVPCSRGDLSTILRLLPVSGTLSTPVSVAFCGKRLASEPIASSTRGCAATIHPTPHSRGIFT